MKIRTWWAAIGFLGASASVAQDRQRDFSGWLFDRRGERPAATGLGRFDPLACSQLWEAAWRAGPRLGRGLVGEIEPTPASGSARLTLLLAMGLGGGRSVRDYLEKVTLQRRPPAEVVAACVAASRPLAGVAPEALQRVAGSRQRREVERLAAVLALLASGATLDERTLADLGDRGLQRLLTGLIGCRRPDLPLRAPLEPPPATAPEPGSLAELAERAALLSQATRQELWPPEIVLQVQRTRHRRVARIASLAVGRLTRVGTAEDLTRESSLDQPMFLCGLEGAEASLQDLLIRGPGASRDAGWHARWWAAAARLVDAAKLDRVLAALVAIEADETARDGLTALCYRLLIEPSLRLQPDEPVRAALLAPARSEADRFRLTLAYLTLGDEAWTEERTRRLEPRTRFALELFRAERLGPAETAGATLWRHLRAAVFAGAPLCPGTSAAAVLEEVNALVHDVLVGGRRSGRDEGWSPDGIREAGDYYAVLDQHLTDWPLFRDVR